MRKAFFDIGPGVLNSEAWSSEWDGWQTIGVEADPKRFLELRNEFPGILLNYAVDETDGAFLQGQIHPTSGFIAGGHPGAEGEIKVKTITLDSLDELFGGFDEIAIWADIEGSELRMLKGAEKVLEKTNWIRVEVRENPTEGTSGWATAEQVYNFLTEKGFKTKTPRRSIKGHHDVIFKK